DRLSELLSNLGGNACQHRRPGTPVLVRADGTQARSVTLEVRNEGAIPGSLLPVIFDPLRAGAGGKKSEGGRGLGLGLYISQQIVIAHGGTIRVESSEGEGTRLIVELPRRSGGSDDDQAHRRMAASNSGSSIGMGT